MGLRTELTRKFKEICPNVYFQPPATVKLTYPCIIYSLDDLEPIHADDFVYGVKDRYSVLYITRNPDDMATRTIACLPSCRMNRAYTADNLYHYSYRLYH